MSGWGEKLLFKDRSQRIFSIFLRCLSRKNRWFDHIAFLLVVDPTCINFISFYYFLLHSMKLLLLLDFHCFLFLNLLSCPFDRLRSEFFLYFLPNFCPDHFLFNLPLLLYFVQLLLSLSFLIFISFHFRNSFHFNSMFFICNHTTFPIKCLWTQGMF